MNNPVLLLRNFYENPYITQRQIATELDVSLGTVNNLISSAEAEGLIIKTVINEKNGVQVTKKGMTELEKHRADRAVILAAGFGSRFVPLTWETPKGLLPVFGERMLERQIRQLNEAGITDIYVMVGYLKEKFEYLRDKFGVKLIYNPEYDRKNTISTLHYAKDVFSGHNTYLLNSDNWLRDNIYHTYEPDSWYSAVYMNGRTGEWCLEFNRKHLITDVEIGGEDSWVMYGPIFFSKEFSEKFFPVLDKYYEAPGTEQDYWENVYVDWIKGSSRICHLKSKECPELYANLRPDNQVYEFENLKELRAFDDNYLRTSNNEAMRIIAETLHVPESEIKDIRNLKAGMTNRSFGFTVDGKEYICRVPGEGSNQLVNRHDEYENILAVRNLGITENILYYNPDTGYKISGYYTDAVTADIDNDEDMRKCMEMLKRLHNSGVRVAHRFDIGERIAFYERLCMTHGGVPYEDYPQVRENSVRLLDKLSSLGRPEVLAHVDSVKDNFLFVNSHKELKLIDWEYAGMADPLIDIAMCSIYSYFDKVQADHLTDLYFGESVPGEQERGIVYAYMALGGLLWALWAVYKSQLGVNFGEYTLIQYRYAKDFYAEAMSRLT